MAAESRTAVLAAMAGNGALAVLKGIAAFATGSAAMLAETFHSLADTGNQVLLFLGHRLARRPPDAAHPFGHGMNVYFWSFVVSLMLFSVGGAFAIWEAVRTFLHPHPHEWSIWSYAILGASFVLEAGSLAVALKKLGDARGDRSLRRYWRENRDPTLPTVVFEDSAAIVSLAVAAAGLLLAQATGDLVWDGVASAVIGLILIGVAVVLAFESYSLLLGEAAPHAVEETVCRIVSADPAVGGVLRVDTMQLGPERVLVVVRARFRSELSADAVADGVARLHEAIGRAVPSTRSRLIVIEAWRDAEQVRFVTTAQAAVS
jgi:cation diffusion facilitator family transporter